jgi:hypothetical protein
VGRCMGWAAGILAALIAAVLSLRAAANEVTPAQAASDGALEATRATLRESVLGAARSIDSWFGNVPFEQGGGRVTDGQVNLELYYNEEGNLNPNLRFKVNVRMPNVERQTYAFIGRDNPADAVSDRPDDLTRQNKALAEQRDEKQVFAGLGRPVGDNIDLRVGVRGGLKPFAQARFRQRWVLSPGKVLDFRETVFADPDAQLGSTTALSYEQALRPNLAFRWLSSSTVTQLDPYFKWAGNVGLYKELGEQRLASAEIQVNGTIRGEVPVTDYGLQATWEQPVYKDFLLGEVLVGRFWPRKDLQTERQGRWVGGLYLKMRF